MIAILILLLTLTAQSAVDLYLPSFPALVISFHTEPHVIQLTLTIFLLGLAGGQLLFGPLSDHYGRKPALIFGIIIYFIASLTCIFIHAIIFFIILRFLQGLGAAALNISSRAILRDYYHEKALTKALSLQSICWGSVPIIAPCVGSYIQQYLHWRMNFVLLALLSGMTFLFIVFFYQESRREKTNHRFDALHYFVKNYLFIITEPKFMRVALTTSFLWGAVLAINADYPFLLQEKLRVDVLVYGWIMLLIGLAYLLGAFTNQWLVAKFESEQLIFFNLICCLIVIGVMLLLAILGFFNLFAVVFPSVLLLYFIGIIFPNCSASCMQIFPERAASASAVFGFLVYLGGSLGTMIVAHIINYRQFSIAIVILILTLLAFLIYFTQWKKIISHNQT